MTAAKKLDYRPNILARSLRLSKTMTIGLIVPDIQNPTFAEAASKIETQFRKHGYSTILCNANEIPENEIFYLQVLADRQVDGIIISPIHIDEWEDLEIIRKKTPIVLISRVFYKTGLSWVTSANRQAAEQMTKELFKLGHRRIAFLGGTKGTYINQVRFEGYKNAFKNNSFRFNRELVYFDGYTAISGESMMERLMAEHPDIEAVFCINNLVFIGAMKVVQRIEPDDTPSIMMAGFDIDRYSKFFLRPLLSASQDFDQLAETTFKLMLDRIENKPKVNDQIVVPMRVQSFNME
jgi:LacI family transcriptional regulator